MIAEGTWSVSTYLLYIVNTFYTVIVEDTIHIDITESLHVM